jgi:hypothetical protein
MPVRVSRTRVLRVGSPNLVHADARRAGINCRRDHSLDGAAALDENARRAKRNR